MLTLYVNENVTISGTKNMNILKVNYLEVAANKLLTIEDGFLVINETAVAGKGSEKINFKTGAAYRGMIIAYDADNNILCWDNANSEWVLKADYEADYSEVSIEATTAEELAWAFENGVGEVTLKNDIATDESFMFENEKANVTLNLNNKKISLNVSENHLAAIKATAGILTLKGNGTVEGLTEGTEDLSALAVWAKGTATINIEGGNYTTKGGNSTIYVNSNDAKINISGGTFGGASRGFVLNQENNIASQRIFVTAGTFINFNPANANNDDKWPGVGNVVNFVDSESDLTVWNMTNNVDVTNSNATTSTFAQEACGKTWTDTYHYIVTK